MTKNKNTRYMKPLHKYLITKQKDLQRDNHPNWSKDLKDGVSRYLDPCKERQNLYTFKHHPSLYVRIGGDQTIFFTKAHQREAFAQYELSSRSTHIFLEISSNVHWHNVDTLFSRYGYKDKALFQDIGDFIETIDRETHVCN